MWTVEANAVECTFSAFWFSSNIHNSSRKRFYSTVFVIYILLIFWCYYFVSSEIFVKYLVSIISTIFSALFQFYLLSSFITFEFCWILISQWISKSSKRKQLLSKKIWSLHNEFMVDIRVMPRVQNLFILFKFLLLLLTLSIWHYYYYWKYLSSLWNRLLT